MDKSYDELVRLAIKGDKASLDELFEHAKTIQAEGRLEDAVRAFRDAATAYRIAASRNGAETQNAQGRGGYLAQVVELHRRWIEANPTGMRPVPRVCRGIDRDSIRRIVTDELYKEQAYAPIFVFLCETLSSLGMEFYSPGGSLQRRVWGLLEIVFGLASHDFGRYLQDSSVRIGLDLLADEVERRVLASGQPHM